MSEEDEETQALTSGAVLKKSNEGEQSITISKRSVRAILIVIVLGAVAAFHLGGTLAPSDDAKDTAGKKPSKWNTTGKIPSWPFGGGGGGKAKAEAAVGKFNRERIVAVREEAHKLIQMLDDYYGGREKTTKMLQTQGWANPWDFSSQTNTSEFTTSQARSDKMVDTVARALVDEDQDTFIIGVIGSSVAAGHDNCAYDTYEHQLDRLFAPVWEAADMKLDVQNAGEGGGCGDTHHNQVFCVKQNVSPFSDVVHYVWHYFEGKGGMVERENLIRWTQMLPRQPPVHHPRPRGQEICPTDKVNPGEVQLFDTYAPYGYNTFCLQTGLYAGGHDYETEKEKDINRFGWGFVGDGYHETTRYGEHENKTRKDSLGVVFRNWHPGPLGFQIVADALAYTYTNAILRALDIIEAKINAGEDPRKTFKSERPILLKDDLPDPIYCDPVYCRVDEAPGCLNFELPTFGWWGARVDDPDDDLNPHRGQVQNWSRWIEPNGDWKMVDKQDIQIYKENPAFCKHSDACGGIEASKPEHGMVVFKLPKMEVGLVILCGCCGKKVAQDMFMQNEFIEIRYNNVKLNNNTWDLYPNAKCVRVLPSFPANAEPSTGHSYLSVKVLEGIKSNVRISHVITL